MPPEQVDRLTISDFVLLLDGIDGRLKMREASAKAGVWVA